MEHLFTYGTLQDVQVQQYVFGNLLKGRSDTLLGFKKLENAVHDQYPLVINTKKSGDKVKGTVYEISFSDLKKADAYETNLYKREKFLLESGLEAWVYIENSQ